MTKSNREFDYFNYTLPTGTAADYATQAVKVLSDIQIHYPEFYSPFCCPSEVLTLSGVRAFDTYYDLGVDADHQRIHGLKQLLAHHDVILVEETFPFIDQIYPDNRYSIVHTRALKELPERYRHMPESDWVLPNFSKLAHDNDFFLWWMYWQRSILLVRKLDPTCQQWLANTSWMAHDMTFGMLLGYPGEAICSNLYQTEIDVERGNILDAAIKHAAAFDGAQPTYGFLRQIATNPNIVAHQKLWSDILDGVYSQLPTQP